MFGVQNYNDRARENEKVFRGILKDMRENRDQRPMGGNIPEDLDSESPIDEIIQNYSAGIRRGIFTILNFTRPDQSSATLTFQDVAILSGGGAELKYTVKEDDTVEFAGQGMTWIS